MTNSAAAAPKLTLAQRVQRIPGKFHSPELYLTVMRAPSDLGIANRNGLHSRREAMGRMAFAINALRQAEKAAGLSAHGCAA